MLEPGTRVASYQIERTLGRGGMGDVYEAVGPRGRRVALKLLRSELGRDPAFVDRFRREGRIQASLEHPHVLPVLEAGEGPQGLFLAMRMIDGSTLADLIRAGGLDAARALRIGGQVAEALDAAHVAGLVHRDVKPGNVLVDAEGNAYLADFGLTRVGVDGAVRGTGATASSGPVLGTVAYLAPEVIAGRAATPASDRYALAAVLFECLSGGTVHPASSDLAVLHAHVSEPAPRISERRAELPRSLDRVLEAGLAKDPERRPATAAELVAEAGAAIGPERARSLGPPPQAAVTAAPSIPAGPRPVLRAPRRRRAAALAAAALAGAAVSAAVLGPLLGGGAEELPPAVPDGAEALGSVIESPGTPVGCRGDPPAPRSPPCSIAQSALPGRPLVVRRDGVIRRWSVRGASGEMALQVLRERDGRTFQVGRSQIEAVPDERVHGFEANLPVEAGDRAALMVARGSAVGVGETGGAETERWIPPQLGSPGSEPDLGPGTGLDRELLLRVDWVPGGERREPRQLLGVDARGAPDGSERGRRRIRFEDGRAVGVRLVETGGGVALDLLRRGRRAARIAVPGLFPGGELIELTAFAYDFEPAGGEAVVRWVNPGSARIIERFFGVAPAGFRLY